MRSAIHLNFSKEKNLEIFQILLETNRFDINFVSEQGNTILMFCLSSIDALRLILKYGPKLSPPNPISFLLRIAFESKKPFLVYKEVLELLVELEVPVDANVLEKSRLIESSIPMIQAAAADSNDPLYFEFLMKHGADTSVVQTFKPNILGILRNPEMRRANVLARRRRLEWTLFKDENREPSQRANITDQDLVAIFNFITSKRDFAQISLVCKTWLRLTDETLMWRDAKFFM
jgi:ankyrin repeat protein